MKLFALLAFLFFPAVQAYACAGDAMEHLPQKTLEQLPSNVYAIGIFQALPRKPLPDNEARREPGIVYLDRDLVVDYKVLSPYTKFADREIKVKLPKLGSSCQPESPISVENVYEFILLKSGDEVSLYEGTLTGDEWKKLRRDLKDNAAYQKLIAQCHKDKGSWQLETHDYQKRFCNLRR
jgi:hypothetical protein